MRKHRLKFDDMQAMACRLGVYVYHLRRSVIVRVSEAIGVACVGSAVRGLER
jgi:hypothetical protein